MAIYSFQNYENNLIDDYILENSSKDPEKQKRIQAVKIIKKSIYKYFKKFAEEKRSEYNKKINEKKEKNKNKPLMYKIVSNINSNTSKADEADSLSDIKLTPIKVISFINGDSDSFEFKIGSKYMQLLTGALGVIGSLVTGYTYIVYGFSEVNKKTARKYISQKAGKYDLEKSLSDECGMKVTLSNGDKYTIIVTCK